MTRYIVGILLAIGLIILVIILLLHGSTSPSKPLDLNSYASSNTAVQFTIDSPVAAATTHHDIIINVSNAQTTLTVTEGYQGQIDTEKSYPMSVDAYAAFLHALTLNGYANGDNSPANRDERGQCALDDRFIYEVIDGSGNDLERYWSTTCNTGTFQGNVFNIRRLFILQVPDYYTLTSHIQL